MNRIFNIVNNLVEVKGVGRKPREYSNGSIFHVFQRGNNKEYLFKSDECKGMLIHIFKDFRLRYDYELLGYVVMDNHYHFIIKVNNDSLDEVMRVINIVFSKYINKSLKRTGHVYDSRYKCKRVDSDSYLLWLLRYIHRNPVRASMVKSVDDYFWSSHFFYKTFNNDIVNTSYILNYISSSKAKAILGYMKYVNSIGDDLHEQEDYKKLSELFDKKFDGEVININSTVNRKTRESLDSIGNRIFKDCETKQLIMNGSRQRYLTHVKVNFIKEATGLKYSLKEISEYLNCAESTISSLLTRYPIN